MVFMAFLGTSINYVDRANLGVAVPFIMTLAARLADYVGA